MQRNLLLSGDGTVLVSDFGLSRQVGLADETAGSPYYRVSAPAMLPVRWMAPGALRVLPRSASTDGLTVVTLWCGCGCAESMEDLVFTKSSDVWSWAVAAWELFTKGAQLPYAGVDQNNKGACGLRCLLRCPR